MKRFFLAFILGVTLQTSLHAEIQSVIIRWTSLLCQDTCMRLLERELNRIPGVDEISLDQGSGQATLTWKARAPFQFSSVNVAMRMVGLSIRDLRIRVRGRIQHSGDNFFIVSDGDGTRFELLNPVTPVRGGVANEFNAAARKISPVLKQQLLEGETQRLIATVEGPVFMPERNTIPTQIVLDHLNFEKPAGVQQQQQPPHPYRR